jgi:hypothetical protein
MLTKRKYIAILKFIDTLESVPDKRGNMGQENGGKLRRFVVWPPEQAERPLQMLQR